MNLKAVVLAVLFLSVMAHGLSLVEASSDVIRVPRDYPSIQDAINAASPGDTIIVSRGYYAEGQINVTKPLTLIARGKVTVDGLQRGWRGTFFVTADNVTISGFTLKNAGYAGIYLYYVNNCKVKQNTITNNRSRPSVGVITLFGSNNVIQRNKISNNGVGIVMTHSGFNVAERNVLISNDNGISVKSSSNCTLRENLIERSLREWKPSKGISLSDESSGNVVVRNRVRNYWFNIYIDYRSDYNFITTNTVKDGVWGIYIEDASHNFVIANKATDNDRSGIGIRFIDPFLMLGHNSVKKNLVTRNRDGITIDESSCNLVEKNVAYRNTRYGIAVVARPKCLSENNTVRKNIVYENQDGVFLQKADYNVIEKNVVVTNSRYGIAITVESSWNAVERNLALRNHEFDLFWDGTGTDNIWTENKYESKNW